MSSKEKPTDEKLLQVLLGASEAFMKYGVKSMTMDDISRELGISKKTLYKYVSDKTDLVTRVMEAFASMEELSCLNIVDESENAIDELIKITEHSGQSIKQIHPSVHFDLQKYYPEAWKVFEGHKRFIESCMQKNIERGIDEGLYRSNVNAEIIAKMYSRKVDLVFDADVFPPTLFSFYDVHFEMIRYHIRGIASDSGIKYLKERIKKDNLNL